MEDRRKENKKHSSAEEAKVDKEIATFSSKTVEMEGKVLNMKLVKILMP